MSSGGDPSSMADLGSAFSSGSSGVGSNSFGFSMPSDFSGGSGDSFAGLSGVQSGMSLPSQSGGSNSFGFAMPSGGGMNLPGLGNALGGASKALQQPAQTQTRAAGGRGVSLQAQNFAAPISDYLPASGSQAGATLLQLLQKFQPGERS